MTFESRQQSESVNLKENYDENKTNTEKDTSDYEAYVEEMARKADGALILNHSKAHAEVILAQLFKTAASEIKILTGALDDDVYGSPKVRLAAKDFVERNPTGKISIISEKDITQNRLLEDLRARLGEDRLTVKRLDSKVNNRAHFAVADGAHLRFEADKEKCEAFVMFGQTGLAGRLSHVFDNLGKSSH